MFGRTVFGDATVVASADPTKPRRLARGADPQGLTEAQEQAYWNQWVRQNSPGVFTPRKVPVDARFRLTNGMTRDLAVSKTVAMNSPVPSAVIPPGTIDPVDYDVPVDASTTRTVPVSSREARALPIGPMTEPLPTLIPNQEQRQWNAWVAQNHPGIFHRPPYVGQRRCTKQHPGGMPTLGSLAGLIGFGRI